MNTRQITALDDAFYRFAAMCANKHLHVMFKGGCLVRHIFRSINNSVERFTKDIDFDLSEEAFLTLSYEYENIIRMGKIRNEGMCNAVLYAHSNIDCDIKIVEGPDLSEVAQYEGPYGVFYGATTAAILADKVSTVSHDVVQTRAKDVIDIYRLVTSKAIIIIPENVVRSLSSKNIGDFSTYLSRVPSVSSLISELRLNESEVYRICDSFIEGVVNYSGLIWNGRIWI